MQPTETLPATGTPTPTPTDAQPTPPPTRRLIAAGYVRRHITQTAR